MNVKDALERYLAEQRNPLQSSDAHEVLEHVTRLNFSGNEHMVVNSSLPPDAEAEVIDQQVEHYGSLGLSFEWKVCSATSTSEFLGQLKAKGFDIGPKEVVVVFDLSEGAEELLLNQEGSVRITNPIHIEDYRAVVHAAFGRRKDESADQLRACMEAGDESHLGFLVYSDSRPVSAGRLYTDPSSAFAGLYGGGTIPDCRGRGHYRSLIGARAEVALAKGAGYLQVDAMPTSLPILLRLGFQPIADSWACNWTPAGCSTPS